MSDSTRTFPPNAGPRKLLTTKELAALYSVTTRTIAEWRATGRIPFLRITARSIRHCADQVERALAKRI